MWKSFYFTARYWAAAFFGKAGAVASQKVELAGTAFIQTRLIGTGDGQARVIGTAQSQPRLIGTGTTDRPTP